MKARLSPITVDTFPLNNPWISYAIYLASILMPAFVFMFAMFTATYSISQETKEKTAADWLRRSNDSIVLALLGKLLPQTLIFVTTGLLYLSILYGYLHFPLNSGFFPMFLAMLLLVLAAQGFAIFCYRYCTAQSDRPQFLRALGSFVILCQWFYFPGSGYASADAVDV